MLFDGGYKVLCSPLLAVVTREGKLLDTGHKTEIFAAYSSAFDVDETY